MFKELFWAILKLIKFLIIYFFIHNSRVYNKIIIYLERILNIYTRNIFIFLFDDSCKAEYNSKYVFRILSIDSDFVAWTYAQKISPPQWLFDLIFSLVVRDTILLYWPSNTTVLKKIKPQNNCQKSHLKKSFWVKFSASKLNILLKKPSSTYYFLAQIF